MISRRDYLKASGLFLLSPTFFLDNKKPRNLLDLAKKQCVLCDMYISKEAIEDVRKWAYACYDKKEF